ncbi:polyphosphate polymerase domain-containing protein [Microbacterium saperdae]|uniref:VTC domain-containing protein n=1 Tax=Microbacterium saperdae TaxID=69368 RepID=A0A543BMU6_9MICO|nr:polyphosphate polymerase domain-containing protein [Microbacterium saperdae]TQL86169.1 VTC domain-containing protein [Microbacterium saperdae]GGM50126.1 VTC domain-containing protein [Microbacterium saperdae]
MMAGLDPVGLEELVAEAALQTRVDRKYAMTVDEAATVLAALPARTRVLTMEGRRSFAYESYYFDTADLLSFRMAALGRRRRFKLRTRSYVDTEDAFLELKTRGARSATVKERIGYQFAARDELTEEGREYAALGLDALGIHDLDTAELLPTLATRYHRTTLLAPTGGGRATIDASLSWELADGRQLRVPGLVIIETKSGLRTGDMDRLLWRHGIRPSTISKYGTGLAALRPDLPSNKWARVLRRRFHPTATAA